MSLSYAAFGGGMIGKATAAAGTPWAALIPSYRDSNGAYAAITRLVQLNVGQGNTANALYLMRPIGRTITAAGSNTSVNTIALSADPGPTGNGIAANDYIAVQNADGTQSTYVVGSWNATTKVLTVTAANLASNVAAGAKVWDFGINTDIDPMTNTAHIQIPTTVNTITSFTNALGGFTGAQVGDPLLLYNPNAINASTLYFAEYGYTRE